METRLENLSVDKTKGPSSAKNMVQLLIQGLINKESKYVYISKSNNFPNKYWFHIFFLDSYVSCLPAQMTKLYI